MRLVLMTSARQATTEVLPALGLLAHQVRIVAPELSSLLDGDSGDVVLVDARYDLVQARTLCALLPPPVSPPPSSPSSPRAAWSRCRPTGVWTTSCSTPPVPPRSTPG